MMASTSASYDWIERDTPEAYDLLIDLLDPEFDPKGIAQRLKTQLTDDAKGVLVGHGYVDKDYRSTFYNFYAKKGRQYRPDCVRLHFFDSAVSYDEARSDLGPAGAFEQDVAFSSTVFRRRNILRANACSNAAAPRARSVDRRFMSPRTASSIL